MDVSIYEIMNQPRRNNLQLMTPIEHTIFDIMQDVEKLGADILLTQAITKLHEARELVADYIDRPIKFLAIEEVAAKYGQNINCNYLNPDGDGWTKSVLNINAYFITEMERGNIKEVHE
jgi:hypothetical protein